MCKVFDNYIGERCGNISISGQTVKQAVDTFERSTITKQKRKQIKTLYIEADEDHVACQRGRRFEARLVYIHEGWGNQWKTPGVRTALILEQCG